MSVVGRERLTAELRQLSRLAVAGRLEDEAAAAVAMELARLRGDLRGPVGSTPWWWEGTDEAAGGWERFNPVAPPIDLSFDGRCVRGTVELGIEFTGPPGVAHGGYVATVLDHVLGIYLSHIRRPSMTAALSVRYLAPTPLGTRLEFLATHAAIDGPRTEAWAELRQGGRTTARADASFTLVKAGSNKNGSS